MVNSRFNGLAPMTDFDIFDAAAMRVEGRSIGRVSLHAHPVFKPSAGLLRIDGNMFGLNVDAEGVRPFDDDAAELAFQREVERLRRIAQN